MSGSIASQGVLLATRSARFCIGHVQNAVPGLVICASQPVLPLAQQASISEVRTAGLISIMRKNTYYTIGLMVGQVRFCPCRRYVRRENGTAFRRGTDVKYHKCTRRISIPLSAPSRVSKRKPHISVGLTESARGNPVRTTKRSQRCFKDGAGLHVAA